MLRRALWIVAAFDQHRHDGGKLRADVIGAVCSHVAEKRERGGFHGERRVGRVNNVTEGANKTAKGERRQPRHECAEKGRKSDRWWNERVGEGKEERAKNMWER
jgi:hypothetical protein